MKIEAPGTTQYGWSLSDGQGGFEVTSQAGSMSPIPPAASSLGVSLVPFPATPTPTIRWAHDTSGDWGIASNWSPARVPDSSDNVLISTAESQSIYISSGYVTVDSLSVGNDVFGVNTGATLAVMSSASFAASLIVLGGTLSFNSADVSVKNFGLLGATDIFTTPGYLGGAGTVTVTGNAGLGDATISGPGTIILEGSTTLASGVSPTIGEGFELANGRVLENSGILSWTAGVVGLVAGTIKNGKTATFDIEQTADGMSGTGLATFTSAGLLEMTSETGYTGIGVPVTNTGTVFVGSGTLGFSDGLSSTGGAIRIASGGTLEIDGGTFAISGGAFADAGVLLIADAQMPLGSTNLTIGNLIFLNGDLDGTGRVTLDGPSTLGEAGGDVDESGSGTTLLKGNTTIEGSISLGNERVLQNAGTVSWIQGHITVGSDIGGGTIENLAEGIFDIETSSTIYADLGGTEFINRGILEQTITEGVTSIGVKLINTGMIKVETGTLSIDGGGSSKASELSVAAGAELEFFGIPSGEGGTFTLSGSTLNIAGLLAIGGGTLELGALDATLPTFSEEAGYGGPDLDGTGTVTILGQAAFTGGGERISQSGTGTTILKGSTSVQAFNFGLFGGRTLENAGTLTFTGGAISLGYNPFGTSIGGATITNSAGATFDFEVSSIVGVGVGVDQFFNAGLLEQTETTDESDIDVAFVNTGKVNVESGTLNFAAGGSSSASAFAAAAGTVLEFGSTGPFPYFSNLGTFTITGGRFDLAGTLAVGGGELELGAVDTTVPNFEQIVIGGDLEGTGTLTVTGNATFNANSGWEALEGGTGTTLLDGTTTVEARLALDGGRVMKNAGTLDVTGGNIDLGYNPDGTSIGGATVTNLARGVFDFETNIAITSGVDANAFLNAGLVEQTFATGTTSIGVAFTNTGTVAVDSGTISFDGAGSSFGGTIDGSGAVDITAASTVSGLTLGGTVRVTNTATVTETGRLTIGDKTKSAPTFTNAAGATFDIANNRGIARGMATGSRFDNAGLLEKTGGSGTSVVAVSIDNTGRIAVDRGTLDLARAVSGKGGTIAIGRGDTLELGAAVSSGQTLAFAGAKGHLVLLDPRGFAGAVRGFAAGDQLDIGGFGTGTKVRFQAKAGGGTLELTDGALTASVALFGHYVAGGFKSRLDGHGGTVITYVPPPAPPPQIAVSG